MRQPIGDPPDDRIGPIRGPERDVLHEPQHRAAMTKAEPKKVDMGANVRMPVVVANGELPPTPTGELYNEHRLRGEAARSTSPARER